MKYFIDFYDAFDGWIRTDSDPEPELQFDDLDEAIRHRDKINEKLGEDNKRMGEHYGVIDSETNCEIQCPSGELKMSLKEDRRCLKVRCLMCDTEVDIPISDVRIISTDQGAGFIQKPEYICEKCGGVCMVILPEPIG